MLRRSSARISKAARLAKDLSQEELAEKFGVSRSALSQFELGKGDVNAGDLPRLAKILGVSTLKLYEQPAENYVSSSDQMHNQTSAGKVQQDTAHPDVITFFAIDITAGDFRATRRNLVRRVATDILDQR